MQVYTLQYSFSALGDEHIVQLRELNQRLKLLERAPLARGYTAFDRVSSIVRPEDTIEKVNIVRTTAGKERFGFFLMVTQTVEMKHTSLWVDIIRKDYPDLSIAVIGSGTEGYRTCETLYQPQAISDANTALPDFGTLLKEELKHEKS